MPAIAFMVVAVLALAGVSSLSDGQWGRGVRGAVRAGVRTGRQSVRDSGVRGVLGGLSAARGGWASGRKDTAPSGRRTVGKTPPADTLLTTVLGRLAAATRRGVRAVRDRVSGRHPGDESYLVVGADGQGRYVDVGHDEDLPTLLPGERLHGLDAHGRALPDPLTYDDQQSGAGHVEAAEYDRQQDCYCRGTKHWPSQEDTCPWCTGALSLIYSYDHPNGAVYSNQIGWNPGDPIPDTRNGFTVMDPKTGDPTGKVTADELRQLSAATTQPAPAGRDQMDPLAENSGDYPLDSTGDRDWGRTRSASAFGNPEVAEGLADLDSPTRSTRGDTVTQPLSDGAAAIETLPEYRRYLAAVMQQAQAEIEDTQAATERLTTWSTSIREAVSRFAAMHGDPKTINEGHSVAEGAHLARESTRYTQRLLNDLVDHIQTAMTGLARHDQVQEAHDAGMHLDRGAYAGN